jgi:hypothetical protein
VTKRRRTMSAGQDRILRVEALEQRIFHGD